MPSHGTPSTTELTASVALPDSLSHAYGYWTKLTPPDAKGPLFGDFHLDELEPQIVPWSVLVDVIPDPLDFKYRFWGTERSKLIGAELTGLTTSAIPTTVMREANFREYADVFARAKPLLCHTPVTTKSGRHAIFQSIRLPLFDDKDRISRIFSAINYNRIDEANYEFYGTKTGTY